MRKSGPFRSIRLCASMAVGADSGVAATVATGGTVPVEVAEAGGWLGSLVDCRYQTTNTSKRMQTDKRTARQTRIRYHFMGMGSHEDGDHLDASCSSRILGAQPETLG